MGNQGIEVTIAGARGTFQRDDLLARIARLREEHDVVIQLFDPGAVYSKRHLEAAADKALRAHRQDRGGARDLAVEIACYAAGTDQIDEALATCGVPTQGDALVAVAVGDGAEATLQALLAGAGMDRDDALADQRDPAVLDRLGVPETTRQVVPEDQWELLVIERVALVDAGK